MDKFQKAIQDIAFLMTQCDTELNKYNQDAKNIIAEITKIFINNDIRVGAYAPNGKIEKLAVK